MDFFEYIALQQHEENLKLQIEYRKLQQNPPLLVKIGDRVLVAIGLIGYGFQWARQECEVVDVSGCSAKITWSNDSKSFHEWVDIVLIIFVLSRKKKGPNEKVL